MISCARGAGECGSLSMQKTTNSLLYNMALMDTGGGGLKDPHHPTLNPLCLRFVQINHSNHAKCEHRFLLLITILAVRRSDCSGMREKRGGKKGLLWSAMGSNGGKLTFIDTRLSEWGRAAVHFQFQPTDWNPPLGPAMSQAPFSEPMVWKT